MPSKFSRRSFLVKAAMMAGSAAFIPAVAGCAPKAEPTAPAPAQQPATKPAAAQPAAPELITLRYLAYQGRWGTHQVEFVNRYAADNADKVKEVVIEEAGFADAAKKLEAYMVTGTMPDAGYLDTAFFPYMAIKGAFQAIDDLAAADGLDLSKRFNQTYYQKFTDGKSMAIGGAAGITPAMICYNKTMAQEKGVKLPHNDWDVTEFEEFITAMADPDAGIFGCDYIVDGTHGSDGWLRRWGGRYISEDGKTCMFDQPEMQAAIQWMMRMMDAGIMTKREDRTEGATKMFVTGALASFITNAGTAGSAAEGIGDVFEYDFALLPKGPLCETADPCRGFAPYANAIWSSSQTKYPEHAFGMQKYVTSPDCAKWSVYNLGRNPGSDLTVWRDPEILKDFPIWGPIADLMENPAGRFPMPDNLRYLEYMDVGTAEYGKIAYGDVPYNSQTIAEATAKVQTVLDLPRP